MLRQSVQVLSSFHSLSIGFLFYLLCLVITVYAPAEFYITYIASQHKESELDLDAIGVEKIKKPKINASISKTNDKKVLHEAEFR